jgi:hypothetical protein
MEMLIIKIAIVMFLAFLLLIENVSKKWNKRKPQPKKLKQDFSCIGGFRIFPWPLI